VDKRTVREKVSTAKGSWDEKVQLEENRKQQTNKNGL